MSKYQAFFWLLLSFLGGVFLCSFLVIPDLLVRAMLLLGALGWALSWRGVPIAWRKRWPFIIAGLCLMAFSLGAWRFNAVREKYRVLTQFVEAKEGLLKSSGANKKLPVVIQGYVDETPVVSGNHQRLTINALYVRPADGYLTIWAHERVQLTTELYPTFKFGQTLEITGDLSRPAAISGSDFDYAAYLAKDNIFTVMSYPEIKPANLTLPILTRWQIKIYSKIYNVKSVFESSLQKLLPEPQAGLAAGVLLGTRSGLPQDVKDDFSRSGVTHIIAISGYNITLVIGVISAFSLMILRRKQAFWLVIFGVFCFVIMTGAQASVMRAAIMGLLALLAKREGRQSDAANSLILAAFVMVLYQPMILRYDVGFQLSFVATLGLIYLTPLFLKMLSKRIKWGNFNDLLATTGGAQLAVLPLLLFYFKTFSLYALPANLTILPFVPLTMLFGFLAGICGIFVPLLGSLVAVAAWFFAEIVLFLSHLFSHLPGSVWEFSFPWYALAVCYAILVFFTYRRYRAIRTTAATGDNSALE